MTKDSNSLITSLCIEYIGESMTLNEKDSIFLGFKKNKLTPQLIKVQHPYT